MDGEAEHDWRCTEDSSEVALVFGSGGGKLLYECSVRREGVVTRLSYGFS